MGIGIYGRSCSQTTMRSQRPVVAVALRLHPGCGTEVAPKAMKVNGSLEIPDEALSAFCRRWKIREFALFGSVLREDFGPDSDIDVLVRFERDVGWDLWDIIDMQEELEAIFRRPVDLVDRDAVEGSRNPFRKAAILRNSQVVYTCE